MPKIVDPDNLTTDVSVIWGTGSAATRTITVQTSADNASSLVAPLESGSDSGVTLQCLYSFAKEEWKNGPQADNLIKIPFPFVAITKNQFDLVNFWDFADDDSRYLIRDAGWSVQSGSITVQEWVGIRTLGTITLDSTTTPPDPALSDQVYFVQSGSANAGGSGAAVNNIVQNFKMSGSVNQAILHYSASTDGLTIDRNFRGNTTLYLREYKKIYDDANIQSDLGVTTQEYTLYSVPLTTTSDVKVNTTSEAQASTDGPWNKVDLFFLSGSGFTAHPADGSTVIPAKTVMSGSDGLWYISEGGGTVGASADIADGNDGTLSDWVPYVLFTGDDNNTYVSASQNITGSVYSVFNVIILNGTGSVAWDDTDTAPTNAKTGSLEDVYTAIQYKLRQPGDINDSTHFPDGDYNGKQTRLLLSFVGDTLITSDGVFVGNQQDADTNRIDFYDVSGSLARYPFVSTGIISWNDNLSSDVSGSYFMFFTNLGNEGGDASGSFGLPAALLVNDASDPPVAITGSTSGSTQRSYTFDYTNNVQGGRTSQTDANVTVVAIGFETAQYVTTTATILETKTNNISLVAALERNYENPA